MLYNDTLSLVKPKRLYEDKNCIIDKGILSMELGATTILAPFTTNLVQTVEILIKHLWNGYLDGAVECASPNKKLPSFETWNEIPISTADVAVFSSIAAAGEDTFWMGCLGTTKNAFMVSSLGFTWWNNYTSQKVFKEDIGFSMVTDYYVFYYLFQMFKELTGKKIATLYWQQDSSAFYLTNANRDYFIVCSKFDPGLMFRCKYKDMITKSFECEASVTPKQFTKKQIQEQATSSETKHLLRPCEELVEVREMSHFSVYKSGSYVLAATKEKK